MRNVGAKKFVCTTGALAALSILLSAAAVPPGQSARTVAVKEAAPAGNSLSLELDPLQSKVHWTLPSSLHTVHGTFAVVRGMMSMQRVMEDTSYANSIEIYLERCRGDVWTLEMKDRNQKDLELFAPFKNNLKKKIAIGVVSHRQLQADRPQEVAAEIRKALKYIPAEKLVVSNDCGFGRQGCNREIAFYKASAIAQAANIVRKELGLPTTYIPAADPGLQVDVVPGRAAKAGQAS